MEYDHAPVYAYPPKKPVDNSVRPFFRLLPADPDTYRTWKHLHEFGKTIFLAPKLGRVGEGSFYPLSWGEAALERRGIVLLVVHSYLLCNIDLMMNDDTYSYIITNRVSFFDSIQRSSRGERGET